MPDRQIEITKLIPMIFLYWINDLALPSLSLSDLIPPGIYTCSKATAAIK